MNHRQTVGLLGRVISSSQGLLHFNAFKQVEVNVKRINDTKMRTKVDKSQDNQVTNKLQHTEPESATNPTLHFETMQCAM
jgi:hypothetical protein